MGVIVLVCRSGGEYGPAHANWLARQIPKEIPVWILTDYPIIQFERPALPLGKGWPGWWAKIELFRPTLFQSESILYFDLDTVILNPAFIPDFLTFGRSLMLRDAVNPHQSGSGIMLLRPEDRPAVWDAFVADPARAMMENQREGDQQFIRKHLCHDWFQTAIPEHLLFSYKVNISQEHGRKMYRGGGDVEKASVIFFHGRPRPWDVEESWIPKL